MTKKLSMLWKKLVLMLHIAFSGIMLGSAAIFLIVSLTAATTDDPAMVEACYRVLRVLATSSVRASTIGTVVTGIVLSVGTHWGLVKYDWLIAKQVLTLVTIVVGFVGMNVWTLRGLELASGGSGGPAADAGAFVVNETYLFIGIGLQLVSLVAMFALSVYKPRGKRGARAV